MTIMVKRKPVKQINIEMNVYFANEFQEMGALGRLSLMLEVWAKFNLQNHGKNKIDYQITYN